MELSCLSADDTDAIQKAVHSAVERSLEIDRALSREWGKGLLNYRDAVYTRYRDLDLSPMDVYFSIFFNTIEPAEPPLALVQAPLSPDPKCSR